MLSEALHEASASYAFLWRGLLEYSSNRTQFTLDILWVVFSASTWGFLGIALGNSAINETVQQYGTSTYLDFLIIGQITSTFFWLFRGNISGFVNSREFAMFWMAPCRWITKVIGMNSRRYCLVFIDTSALVVVGVVFFDLTFNVNLGLLFVILGGLYIMVALELVASGITVVTKSKQDPVNWFLSATSSLVTGVWYPVTVLPGFLQILGKLHPQFYLLGIARKSIGGGYPLSSLWGDLSLLLVTGTALMVVGVVIFRWGFKQARVEGTIGHI